MGKSNKNTRCPLQVECEKRCEFAGHELDCPYYEVNAWGDNVIEDQEAIREERWRAAQRAEDEAAMEALVLEDETGTQTQPPDPVSDLGTGKQIEYINIALLEGDPNNFYELSDLEGLAGNIELTGLQQPLVVRPHPTDKDCYKIVSGHRRKAALDKLVEEGKLGFVSVPCIVDRTEQSEAMWELRLICANSDTRKMSSADLAKQAQRVEMLLYQLKEEGMEFPGRMRDHVAEACKISKSKLARLNVITKGLFLPFKAMFNADKLSEQAAYALARLPVHMQTMAHAQAVGTITGGSAERLLEHYEQMETGPNCTYGFPGEKCSNCAGFVRAAVRNQYSWRTCDGTKCCMTCRLNEKCPGKCIHRKEADKVAKSDAANEKAKRKAREAAEQAERKRKSTENAKRLMRAIEAAGLKGSQTIQLRASCYSSEKIADICKAAAGDWGDTHLYATKYTPSELDAAKLAPKLGCSADYLLGLSDDLTPRLKPPVEGWVPLEWADGHQTPPRDGPYYCKFDADGHQLHKVATYRGGGWFFPGSKERIDAKCLAWFPLPVDKEGTNPGRVVDELVRDRMLELRATSTLPRLEQKGSGYRA